MFFIIIQFELFAIGYSLGISTIIMLNITLVGVIIALFGNQLIRKNGTITFGNLLLACVIALSFVSPLSSGFFLNSYSNAGNIASKVFSKDQFALTNYIKRLDSTPHDVATWITKDDPSGYIGSLQSTISFHLLRLEGIEPDTVEPDTNRWRKDYGKLPSSIIVISKPTSTLEFREFNYDLTYKMTNTFRLPSQNAIVTRFSLQGEDQR